MAGLEGPDVRHGEPVVRVLRGLLGHVDHDGRRHELAERHLVRRAARFGEMEGSVEVRPADLNHSFWDNTLERTDDSVLALRLGLRQIDGLLEEWA